MTGTGAAGPVGKNGESVEKAGGREVGMGACVVSRARPRCTYLVSLVVTCSVWSLELPSSLFFSSPTYQCLSVSQPQLAATRCIHSVVRNSGARDGRTTVRTQRPATRKPATNGMPPARESSGQLGTARAIASFRGLLCTCSPSRHRWRYMCLCCGRSTPVVVHVVWRVRHRARRRVAWWLFHCFSSP